MQIDFSPLQELVNSLTRQLGTFAMITLGTGLIVFFLLRAIKIPNKLALIIATVSLLVAGYYTLFNLTG